MKVGSLVSMYIALDPCGIDFAYPAKVKRRSALSHGETVNGNRLSAQR